ncbi:hypothetical protein [Oceanobacillus sp. FSL K6-0251]|uniref:hypothetical protein n=1 Tax=Oceanobacillus sp. FSL K6-0251 TaxID=2921602 RepID=UPI0030FB89F1
MNPPLNNIGINLNIQKITKKQLKEWNESKIAHVVALHTNGGIYTSNGNGVYESAEYKFNNLRDFWEIAKNNRNTGFMYEL